MKVAVSGVGGGVGQSIMKALTISSLPVEIYPVDVQPVSAGLFRGVYGTVLPKPEAAGGIEVWERWIVEEKIDALIPGSDFDLAPLATVRDEWEHKSVCAVLVSDMDLVNTGADKAVTCEMLRKEGIPVPESVWDISLDDAVSWAKSMGYPIVMKPRTGSASHGVHVVRDEEELRFYFPRTAGPILQEHLRLSDEEDEYTCAVFVDRTGTPVGRFMARRELSGGATYRAEVNFWPEIDELLVRIGTALRPRGPLNVQLRMTERGPVPFELNVRCSGTTAIRAHFGYNEPEMWLRHYVLGEELVVPKIQTGYAFRYWNEVFLDDVGQERIMEGPAGLKGEIRAWP